MDEPRERVCPQCGATLAAGQRFCEQCGSDGTAEVSAPGGLSWEADVALLTNPLVLRQLVTALALSGLIMFALLSFMFAIEGEWESIPMALLICVGAIGVVALLTLVVVVLFFGNRIRARFAVSEEGVSFATVDRRAKATNRLAVALGLLGRSPGTAGAGMIGMAREREAFSWRSIASATYQPRWHGITLRNRWRTVAFLACTPGNYDQVAAYVRRHVVTPATPIRSPLPRFLGRSALVVLASLPVFLLPYPFELDPFVPLLMVCFALATIWLVHLFGWVVIGAALWIVAEIVLIALGTRESVFAWQRPYRTYEILDAGDWFALALAAAGLAYLIIFSYRAARGHIPSVLSQDHTEDEE